MLHLDRIAICRLMLESTLVKSHTNVHIVRLHLIEKKPYRDTLEPTLVKKIHNGKKIYKCPQCQAAFSRSSSLKQHIRIHTGEKPYKCPHTCKKSYKCLHCSIYFRHNSNTGEKPYKCYHCLVTFINKSSQRDILSAITGEKSYRCPHGNAAFSEDLALNEHMRIHAGEKPYKCLH